MKRFLLLIAVTVAVFTPVAARASATTQKIPFDIEFAICNGDVVHLSGTLLAVFTETTTRSGGTYGGNTRSSSNVQRSATVRTGTQTNAQVRAGATTQTAVQVKKGKHDHDRDHDRD